MLALVLALLILRDCVWLAGYWGAAFRRQTAPRVSDRHPQKVQLQQLLLAAGTMAENGLDSKPPRTRASTEPDASDIPLDFSIKRPGGRDHVTPSPMTSSVVTSQATPPVALFAPADRAAALASALSAAGLLLRAPTAGAALLQPPGQTLPNPLGDVTDKVQSCPVVFTKADHFAVGVSWRPALSLNFSLFDI